MYNRRLFKSENKRYFKNFGLLKNKFLKLYLTFKIVQNLKKLTKNYNNVIKSMEQFYCLIRLMSWAGGCKNERLKDWKQC